MNVGFLWGAAMVLCNVGLLPLDRTIYGTDIGVGRAGEHLTFQRPFLCEFVMFVAMACCLLLEIPSWCSRRREARASASAGGACHEPAGFCPSRTVAIKLLAPALCDLLGSWFLFTGALWVPASIVEMLGCSNVVFTALLSRTFLRKDLAKHEVRGVLFLVFGIVLVGLARLALVDAEGNKFDQLPSWSTPVGLLMVLMAHLWYAVEFVVTEKLLADNDVSAFLSVGVMGLWGAMIFVVLFPVLALTPGTPESSAPAWHEELGPSLSIIAARPALAAELGALWLMLLLFNAAAFKTTELLSALTRVVMGQLVSPLVWLLDLALAVVGLSSGAAERWTAWSYLQLLGFVVLVNGTLLYNAVWPYRSVGGDAEARDAGLSLVQAGGGSDPISPSRGFSS